MDSATTATAVWQVAIFLTTAFTLLQGAVWGYRRLFLKPQPPVLGWLTHSRKIVEVHEDLPGVQLLYDTQYIDSLSRTTVAVWYAGDPALRLERVSNNAPLRLQAEPSGQLMRVARLAHSSEASDLSTEERRGKPPLLKLRFDHLENGDGAAFEVVHTGSLQVNGSLIDVDLLHYESGQPLDTDYRKWARRAARRKRYRYRRYVNQFAFITGVAAVFSPAFAIAMDAPTISRI